MKLPEWTANVDQDLEEFDIWLTPSLQEIQSTEKFQSELDKIETIISSLGSSTNEFDCVEHCHPDVIGNTCVKVIENLICNVENIENKISISTDILEALASLLFLVTGKSDNNLKCQFPARLFQGTNRTTFPQRQSRNGNISFADKELGRTLKSDKIAKIISEALVWSMQGNDFSYLEEQAKWLLSRYVSSILQDDSSIRQFWALGRSYFSLKATNPGTEKALLAPIVTFKVRGSVSASGGHLPEEILREALEEWGLERGTDFNLEDVIVGDNENTDATKTRAYDFALPYRTPGWNHALFIQCQFYAGDSGSVSHKVVDQTSASRTATLGKFPDASFVEYLDGAGYYASLNTDLRHMLSMATTKSFIQVRSLNIRLRRELQHIGFITPVEIEHAIMRSADKERSSVEKVLVEEGYTSQEIKRGLNYCMGKGFVQQTGSILEISDERLSVSRRLLIVDIVAKIGAKFASLDGLSGNILIPGYGPLFGASIELVSETIDEYAPNANYDRNSFCSDMQWLCEQKNVLLR